MALLNPSTWFAKAAPPAPSPAPALPPGPAAPVASPGAEIGTTGLRRFGGYIDEELLTKLSGRKAARVFREMGDNDAISGAILYIVEMLFRQAEWRTEPAISPRGKEAAALWDEIIDDMEHTWDEWLSEIVSFLQFGWSYFEVVLKLREGASEDRTKRSRFSDGRVGIRKLSIRSQDSLDRWEFDDCGDLVGMWQQDVYASRGPVLIPLSKALLFRTTSKKNNPESKSLLRPAYRSWYFAKRLEEIEAIGIERELAGLPVIELPPEIMNPNGTPQQKATRATYEKSVQQIRRDERDGLVMPAELNSDGKPTGYKIRLMSSGGSRAIDPGKAIVRHQQRQAMTMLAEFLFLGMQEVGARALAETKTSLFSVALGGLMESITSTINRDLIPKVMALNGYAAEDCPKMVTGEVEAPNLKELAEFVNKLVGVGVLVPDEALERKLRMLAKLPEKPKAEPAPTAAPPPLAPEPATPAPGEPGASTPAEV